MNILVGYTGFVGSNLCSQHRFDGLYNSKNISGAFGTQPDLLVYSGVPAEMFLANSNPAADLAVCENAAENIRKIDPKRLVLISTIAVLDSADGACEDYSINTESLKPYGANRHRLEQLAREIVGDCHIIRLPALFGKGLKKNFIYDIINPVPMMLRADKYAELSAKEPLIAESYELQSNGFYGLQTSAAMTAPPDELKAAFSRVGFSTLNFTDSRSVYQFYNLAYLWKHIEVVLRNDIPLLHLATEPIAAREVCKYVTGSEFTNELPGEPIYYDFRTKYAEHYGGRNGYLFDKSAVLREIKGFVHSETVNI